MSETRSPGYSGETMADRTKDIPSPDWQAAMRLREARLSRGSTFTLRDLSAAIFFETTVEAFDRAKVVLELMLSSELVEKVDDWRFRPKRQGASKW